MKVILPGSYDPITLGHAAIIERAAKLYDEVFVVAFINPEKTYTFTPDERVRMMILATEKFDNVIASYSTGMVVDYMRDHGIEKIIKGYRNDADLEYERRQAEFNLKYGGFETELWLADESFSSVSSTMARKMIENGEDLREVLDPAVISYLERIRNS